jgi:tripartite-type tricarboxylate transporter receptor subunit TctC
MLLLVVILVIGALLAIAGCRTSRSGYKSAPYTVVRSDGDFELRDYPALKLVETGMKDGGSGGSFSRLFRFITGANMLHVPYRGGGEAINAMVSGETSVYFAPLASALPHVKSGRLRPIAAMSERRISLLPEVPTIAEAGFPGAESGFWHGSMVPSGTPVEVINALHAATTSALKRDDIARRLTDVGYSVIGDPPGPFLEFVKSEVQKWRKVVQATGLTAE